MSVIVFREAAFYFYFLIAVHIFFYNRLQGKTWTQMLLNLFSGTESWRNQKQTFIYVPVFGDKCLTDSDPSVSVNSASWIFVFTGDEDAAGVAAPHQQ